MARTRRRTLGAQLPREIGNYLRDGDSQARRFSSDEFLEKVSEREGADLPASVHHVRVVLNVLQEAVSPGEIRDVLNRLPDDYARLFAGSEGKMLPE